MKWVVLVPAQAVYEEQWEGRTHIVGEEPAPLLLWPGLLGDLLHGDEEALLEVEQRGEVRKHSMQRVAVDDASRGELVGELLQWGVRPGIERTRGMGCVRGNTELAHAM